MTDASTVTGADWTATELGHVQNAMRPSEMTYERASEIVRAICNRSFLAMGLPQHPEGDLTGVKASANLAQRPRGPIMGRTRGRGLRMGGGLQDRAWGRL